MRLYEAARFLRDEMRRSGEPEADVQSRQLLFGLLRLTPSAYFALRDEEVAASDLEALRNALERRMAGEPLQYILGEWPFRGRIFGCDERALIPREDTETLVDCVLSALPEDRPLKGIDLGTGTGIVGLTLAAERPLWDVCCLDISEEALSLARENAERLGLTGVRFCRGSMCDPLPDPPYDFIVSNPPYVRTDEIPGLARELRYEPALALDGGADGLRFYRALTERFSDSLAEGGLLAVEVGYDQAEAVSALFAPAARSVSVFKDMAGIGRVVAALK